MRPAYDTACLVWEAIAYRGRGMPPLTARHLPLPARPGHPDRAARPPGSVHAAAYPEVMTLTELLASPRWRPAAVGVDQFRAELQRRLPPACRDLINTGVLTQATALGARTARWHNPPAEIST